MNSMYVPKQFKQDDPEMLGAVMARYNFAIMTSVRDGAPFATHLPVLAKKEGDDWVIDGHIARANPHWEAFEKSPVALMIFAGPHTYVSPTQYKSSQRVPTWNYITVHATGPVEVLHDDADKLSILASLIAHHDPAFLPQWEAFDDGMRASLLGAIVGLRMRVRLIEGKFKLNQHRLADDRSELAKEYAASDENRREIGEWMARLGLWPALTQG